MERIRRSKIVGLLLAAALGAGIYAAGTAAAGQPFIDTPPWIEDHAWWLASNAIANGYGDGTFRPNDNITRGQAAFWLGNYNDAIDTASNGENFASAAGVFSTAYCPVGKRAVAGSGFTNASGMVMTDSFPVSSPQLESGWQVSWTSIDGGPRTGNAFVTALCIPDKVPNP